MRERAGGCGNVWVSAGGWVRKQIGTGECGSVRVGAGACG